LQKSEHDLDRRALARAVFSENAGDAVGDLEADPVEGDDVPVSLR
jgi:hypothetical protein